MSRYSDSSDSDVSYRKSKKKKHRKSKSRSRSRNSRKKRSKSRSRSRDKRRNRSRSRDRRRSRSRDRRRSRSRSSERKRRSRDRRSKSRDKQRSRSKSDRRSRVRSKSRSNCTRSPSKNTKSRDSDVEIVPFSGNDPTEVMVSITDQLKRARAISDIDSDTFKQQEFKSTRCASNIPLPDEVSNFEFGTSMEKKSKAEEDLEKLAKEGLINPKLFGDQAAREKRYLQHIWTIRQRAVQKMKTSV